MRMKLNKILLASTIGAAFPLAYNTAGWKKDKDGKLELDTAGNPIWIDANGGEKAVEGDTISRLNGEARDLRKRAETAETSLSAFKDIDPAIAKKAIADIAKIDAKKLIDAGEVDALKETMKQEFTAQITELTKDRDTLRAANNDMKINGVFAGSEFIRERVAMPRDFFEAAMKPFFKVNDKGEIEAFDRAGNRVMSKKNIGSHADPQEALEVLVETHPQKDTILKAQQNSGSGNNGNGGSRPGSATMKRAEFDALDQANRAEASARLGKGELSIVD